MKSIKIYDITSVKSLTENVKGHIRFYNGFPVKINPYVRKAKNWKNIPLGINTLHL